MGRAGAHLCMELADPFAQRCKLGVLRGRHARLDPGVDARLEVSLLDFVAGICTAHSNYYYQLPAVPKSCINTLGVHQSTGLYPRLSSKERVMSKAMANPLRRSGGFAALVVGVAILAAACTGVEPADEPTVDASEVSAPTTTPALDVQAGPGVLDDRVVFGQSAAFSGPAQALEHSMRLGIEAAFHEQNQAGGVHGRMLELVTLDDRYEPGFAFANTRDLITKERVFALIGEVGTPTSRSAVPLAEPRAVPFVAPFTGAGFLRDPELESVVNLRASYGQETEHMVERLTEDLGVTRVAVMYQNDSYGQSGLNGVIDALGKRGLEPVATWY